MLRLREMIWCLVSAPGLAARRLFRYLYCEARHFSQPANRQPCLQRESGAARVLSCPSRQMGAFAALEAAQVFFANWFWVGLWIN